MTKGKGGRPFGGGGSFGGGGGMMNMMKQLQQAQKLQEELQEEMAKTREALAEETLTVTAGGGAVTIVITGDQRIRSIALKPEIVNPEDLEMLQDLIVAAVNEAIEASRAHEAKRLNEGPAAQQLQALTGGLGLPGL